MVWVFSLEWLQPVFGTSLSLVIITHTKFSSHLPYFVVLFFPVCAVTDVSGKHESDLKWYELVWNPTCSGTCCSNTGLSAGQIQIKTEFKLGFIHKVSSELWSSAAPSYGCSYISAIFLHLTSLDNVLWKVSNPTTEKKNIPVLVDPSSPRDPLSLRYYIRGIGTGQIFPEMSVSEVIWQSWRMWRAQAIRHKDGTILKRMEREGPGSSPSQALLWLHISSKTREECPALELGRAHWCTWLALPGFSVRC